MSSVLTITQSVFQAKGISNILVGWLNDYIYSALLGCLSLLTDTPVQCSSNTSLINHRMKEHKLSNQIKFL